MYIFIEKGILEALKLNLDINVEYDSFTEKAVNCLEEGRREKRYGRKNVKGLFVNL